jgi:hypothetical protein
MDDCNAIRYLKNGAIVREEPMVFSRLYAVGQPVTIDGVDYSVGSVEVIDGVQVVNLR